MASKYIALTMVALTVALGGLAAAFDGTANKPWEENFQVADAAGAGRNNCAASRFSLKLYKDGLPVTLAATFRNYTANGNYKWRVTPAAAGRYSAFLSYSGSPLATFCTTAYSYDADTLYAAESLRFGNMSTAGNNRYARQGIRFGNLSTVSNRRPTNPLLANDTRLPAFANVSALNGRIPRNPLLVNDARIPATVIATSSEVAKAADWTAARAAKVDNLDAAVSGRATNSGVWAASGRTMSNYSGVDRLMTATHGPGLWSAVGNITVLPFQGAASYDTVAQGKDVHIVRGDSVSIPYSIGKNITGWTVWFGAKANPSDDGYSVPLRDITAYVTNVSQGAGLVSLSSADTAVTLRRYFAEVEIRKAGEVNTVLKFHLWVDPDVIR